MEERKIKVINSNLTKTGIVMANDFVDFKRKAGTELKMSGWLNVRVFNVKEFEVRKKVDEIEKFIKILHSCYAIIRNLQVKWCLKDQEQP